MENKIAIRKWVGALRCGDYTRCFGRLRNDADGSMCAIGLGAYINGIEPEFGCTHEFSKFVGIEVGDYSSIMSINDPNFGIHAIAAMNDTGVSWDTLADILEKKYLTAPVSAAATAAK